VRIRQGDGTRVTRTSWRPAASSWSSTCCRSAGGNPELIRDLLEFRRIFGREIAQLAALPRNADKDWLQRLKLAPSPTRPTPRRPPPELFELDFDFYVAMTSMSGNTGDVAAHQHGARGRALVHAVSGEPRRVARRGAPPSPRAASRRSSKR
jgi:DNA-binding FadR family transcriptional regulator